MKQSVKLFFPTIAVKIYEDKIVIVRDSKDEDHIDEMYLNKDTQITEFYKFCKRVNQEQNFGTIMSAWAKLCKAAEERRNS